MTVEAPSAGGAGAAAAPGMLALPAPDLGAEAHGPAGGPETEGSQGAGKRDRAENQKSATPAGTPSATPAPKVASAKKLAAPNLPKAAAAPPKSAPATKPRSPPAKRQRK